MKSKMLSVRGCDEADILGGTENWKIAASVTLENLEQVEASLTQCIEEHQKGTYGYITRDWGFMTPVGLGRKLRGKFKPWEDKLAKARDYFWPVEAYDIYDCVDDKAKAKAQAIIDSLPPTKSEQLFGNMALHEFLLQPPIPAVELDETDLIDYRTAAKIFILLGTLSHLCGNSAPDRTKTPLPEWIEDPLRDVAKRLKVNPTLSGHFLVQENWVWRDRLTTSVVAAAAAKTSTVAASAAEGSKGLSGSLRATLKASRTGISPANSSIVEDPANQVILRRDTARAIVRTLLTECEIKDRRYRFTIYKNCFVGSQAVDALIDHGFASTREEAVYLGRKINAALKLFTHVTNDHLFKDKMLFYRFRKKWRKTISTGIDKMITTNDGNDSFSKTDDDNYAPRSGSTGSKTHNHRNDNAGSLDGCSDDEDVEEDHGENEDQQQENQSIFSLKGRNASLSGSQSKDSPRRASSLTADSDALIGVSQQFPLSEVESIFFSAGKESHAQEPNDVIQSVNEKISELQRPSMQRGDNASSTSFTSSHDNHYMSAEIRAAINAMRLVKIKDRRYRLKVYRKCFIGSQLIDLLVEEQCASTRIEALRLAQTINQQYRIMEHVCNDHEIKDEYLFFRFTNAFEQVSRNLRSSTRAIPTAEPSSSISSDNVGAELLPTKPIVERGRRQTSSGSNYSDNVKLVQFRGTLKRLDPTATDTDGSVYSESTIASYNDYDASFGFLDDDPEEFRFDNIDMLYPAFGNNHERVNQLIPACMGYALRLLPFLVIDIIAAMRDLLDARLNIMDTNGVSGSFPNRLDMYRDDEDEAIGRLADLLFQVAFNLSRCKEQFQLMSTDRKKRTFNSIHVSIRQTQPLSNGVLVRRTKGDEPRPSKGTSGTHFPYFHLVDWLLGRFQFLNASHEKTNAGLIAQISAVDACFPLPQRQYIKCLSGLHKESTLRGFLDMIGRPQKVMIAYNHLVQCYAGEGGVLTAHCRKLYSYMHNDVQQSTSGTNHAGITSEGDTCNRSEPRSVAERNHAFARTMFNAMRSAAEERWQLRVAPLMDEVEKVVYSTSESGGFTTVALKLSDQRYEYGDVVKVLLPNDDKTTIAWVKSLSFDSAANSVLKLSDIPSNDHLNTWGWKELWEALGWDDEGVPIATIARYIEQAQVTDEGGKSRQWVNSPLDLCKSAEDRLFSVPPSIRYDTITALVPVSPRIYSVSGVELDRVFLLISKPMDGSRHHGYERMADPRVEKVYCSFAPATFFLVPPIDVNLVCIASGTGISPFVGLADALGSRRGRYTIVHQCKSSDLFLSNSQTWLDFTALNPGAVVMGYISGDRSRRNCPMRYMISNGMFEETIVLGRHNSSAYYFRCEAFKARLKEVYKPGRLNLAYCCGGVQSAIDPLKHILNEHNWNYEFTVESYGVTNILTKKKDFSCQIGGSLLDLDCVAPIHEGGDHILRRIHSIAQEKRKGTASANCPMDLSSPDLSEAFWQLHPHAYNLLRCMRTPIDADFKAFAAFLERQNATKSIIEVSASKYAQAALTSPDCSKVVRVASELQSAAIIRQVNAGDLEGAKKSAEYLEALLEHIPIEDENARRWKESLDYFKSN